MLQLSILPLHALSPPSQLGTSQSTALGAIACRQCHGIASSTACSVMSSAQRNDRIKAFFVREDVVAARLLVGILKDVERIELDRRLEEKRSRVSGEELEGRR